MKEQVFQFSAKTYPCYFDADFSQLQNIVDKERAVIITDQNIANLYADKLSGWKTIVIPAGEENKQQNTVDKIILELIQLKADRQSFIIGIGGGVVTDITGYAASVYMRGVKFGLIPTSILAMVDASVGGKNGVDVGIYKNLVGVIKHPEFLMFDYSFLETLPENEWINGFAEVIKHACIKDKELFEELQLHDIDYYINNKMATANVITRNVQLKYKVVSGDEFESGDRKLLNFGHTIGHAIENKYHLPHGHAVSIGMIAACSFSKQLNGFNETKMVCDLIIKYRLPIALKFDKEEIWKVLLLDKKKDGGTMNFVLLNEIGNGVIKPIPLNDLKELFDQL